MKVGYPIETLHFYYSYYKDFDVLVILPMKFGLEAPSMKLCHEISLLSLPVSRKERLLSLGPILCRGLGLLNNCTANQHSFIFIFSFLVFTLTLGLQVHHNPCCSSHIDLAVSIFAPLRIVTIKSLWGTLVKSQFFRRY